MKILKLYFYEEQQIIKGIYSPQESAQSCFLLRPFRRTKRVYRTNSYITYIKYFGVGLSGNGRLWLALPCAGNCTLRKEILRLSSYFIQNHARLITDKELAAFCYACLYMPISLSKRLSTTCMAVIDVFPSYLDPLMMPAVHRFNEDIFDKVQGHKLFEKQDYQNLLCHGELIYARFMKLNRDLVLFLDWSQNTLQRECKIVLHTYKPDVCSKAVYYWRSAVKFDLYSRDKRTGLTHCALCCLKITKCEDDVSTLYTFLLRVEMYCSLQHLVARIRLGRLMHIYHEKYRSSIINL